MDILTDILRSIHLGGGVYFRCEFSAPWGMAIQPTPVAEFHVIIRGQCWLRVADRAELIRLQAGDLVAFPHGDAHGLLDAPDSATVPAERIVEGQNLDHFGPVTYGGGGPSVHILCGYFQFDRERSHPLVAALPSLIHLRGTGGREFAWVQTTLDFMIQETRLDAPGAEAVVSRLAEVLFVQMVRAYLRHSDTAPAMLAALADSQISAALEHMHRAPQEAWSLETLAERAGMSRSAFAMRFNELVGQTPMSYLTYWRMQKAGELLSESQLSTSAIAERVGYQSEASFSKAFKKVTGIGPGAYRRVRGAGKLSAKAV